MNISIHALHQKIELATKNFRKAETELLELLCEMDQRRGYIELGFASLFEYCTHGLKLSEGQASAFIIVGRRAAQVPELKKALDSGEISISKAKRITRVLQMGNASDWIEKAKTYTQREMDLEVARVAPQFFESERRERISERFYRVTIALRAETLEKLESAKDLLETNNLESTLEQVLSFFLEKKDPFIKAKRAQDKKPQAKAVPDNGPKNEPKKPPSQVDGGIVRVLPLAIKPNSHSSRNVIGRRPIPASLSHQVQLKDNGHCQHRYPDGKICKSRRYLHVHHLHPVSLGGGNDLENLQLLCSSHHNLWHARPS